MAPRAKLRDIFYGTAETQAQTCLLENGTNRSGKRRDKASVELPCPDKKKSNNVTVVCSRE
jgi:hypothetical protein